MDNIAAIVTAKLASSGIAYPKRLPASNTRVEPATALAAETDRLTSTLCRAIPEASPTTSKYGQNSPWPQ